MAYPSPTDYTDWQAYCQALIKALSDSPTDLTNGTVYDEGSAGGSTGGGGAPAGYSPVWLSVADANLYLGNPFFSPPTAPDLFQIDTLNLALAAVATANVQNAAIHTAQIADAAIVTALIGDAQIVTAKIASLAVDTGQIANAAITSAKIANLAVGSAQIQAAAIATAHVQTAAITNALIGNVIQSASWDGVHGWQLDKTGGISGTGITILNSDGSIAFASGSLINLATQITGLLAIANISGLGTLAVLNSITPANTSGFGALSLQNFVTLGSADVIGTLPLTSTSGNLDIARTTGFGSLAAISLLTSGNISTYIAGAAIGSALIANLAVGTAAIDNLAVTTAKIDNLAVTSAKIFDLVVDKISSGQLDATITVGAGIFDFTVGGATLLLGNGFGTSSQFFLWYGPTPAGPASCTELAATLYLKTNGDAYFGGSLSAGVINNSVKTTLTISTAEVTMGPFLSNAGDRVVTLSYYYLKEAFWTAVGGTMPSSAGTFDAQVVVERNDSGVWNNVATLNVTGTEGFLGTVGDPDYSYSGTISGSTTVTDSSGGTSITYRARINTRNLPVLSDNGNTLTGTTEVQEVSLISVET